MRRPYCILAALACLAPPVAQAQSHAKGRIFEPKLSPEAPMFFYETSRQIESGREMVRTRYNDPQGKPLVEEDTLLTDGKLEKYTYAQHQTNESGTIEVKGGRVFHSFTTQGKTKTDNEKWEEGMLVPDMIGPEITRNWEKLAKGDNLQIRLLLVEIQDSVGFKIFRDEEITYLGKPALKLRLKPSSIFISAVVSSIKLVVEKEPPHRILEMDGRLPLRIAKKVPPQSRRDWVAMDGRLVFDYSEGLAPSPASAPGEPAPSPPASAGVSAAKP